MSWHYYVSKWMWKLFGRVQCFAIHGILQAKILGWVTFSFSRESSQPRDWTQVSDIADRFFPSWATREAQESWSWCISEDCQILQSCSQPFILPCELQRSHVQRGWEHAHRYRSQSQRNQQSDNYLAMTLVANFNAECLDLNSVSSNSV